MIKNYFLLAILSLLPFISFSQQDEGQYKLSFTGFVRADALFDSRQTVEAREGFLLFYPKKPLFDKDGKDINAQPAFNQYAMTTRMTAKITGPDILGARASAQIESDFTGASNAENNSLRLRHAYINLQWNKTRLLMGQYWHPVDIPEMIPNVLGLNTGAPFHSFSRQPQVRIERKFGHFDIVGVVASQRDYVNRGPAGNSYEYLRNSPIPNLHSQVRFKNDILFAGIGVDFKKLKPRLVTDSNFVSNETVNCWSYIAFLTAKISVLTIKSQYTLNRALNDHLMMGGFGVTSTDEFTDRREYSPLTYHSAWLNISYGKGSWQPSLFAGYTVNISDMEEFTGAIYARDADIDYVYRISPMITYIRNKLSFMFELEYTAAAWMEDETQLILLKNRETGVLRAGIAAVYSF